MRVPSILTRLRLWPRSLFGRLTLILFFGLVAAHALSFGLILHERARTIETMMVYNLARDIAISVAVLERVPPNERSAWLPHLERKTSKYVLGPVPNDEQFVTAQVPDVTATIASALGPKYVVSASAPRNTVDPFHLRLHLQLADGTPLTVEMSPSQLPLSIWVPLVVLAQLATLAFVTWLAVRLASRSLAQLARAADSLGPELRGSPLPENGPLEVARAATAFNAMQRRIADYLAERMQILAAISHDLQTPITRMRLRADLMDDTVQREKLYSDLNAMQALVQEGIAYVRGVHGVTEAPCRTDLHALLDSLVCDYVDAGKPTRLIGRFDHPMITRPHTLRRIIINLLENALKFGTDPEIQVDAELADRVSIAVRDRGPGIPQAELQAVLQPFYRVEGSRNRDTGGTGLGLAIAQQLTLALNGTLALSNRDGGGLEVRLSLPCGAPEADGGGAKLKSAD